MLADLNVSPAGSASLRTTFAASLGPLLVTVNVQEKVPFSLTCAGPVKPSERSAPETGTAVQLSMWVKLMVAALPNV